MVGGKRKAPTIQSGKEEIRSILFGVINIDLQPVSLINAVRKPLSIDIAIARCFPEKIRPKLNNPTLLHISRRIIEIPWSNIFEHRLEAPHFYCLIKRCRL